MILSGKDKCWPQSFTICTEIRSGPWAFLELRPVIMSSTSLREISKLLILLFVRKRSSGSTLSFTNGVHWDVKKSLKREALLLQSVTYFPCINRGGILGILHLFKSLFKIFQYVFCPVLGSANLEPRSIRYFF